MGRQTVYTVRDGPSAMDIMAAACIRDCNGKELTFALSWPSVGGRGQHVGMLVEVSGQQHGEPNIFNLVLRAVKRDRYLLASEDDVYLAGQYNVVTRDGSLRVIEWGDRPY